MNHSSPAQRPEPGQEPPLPTYHELLNQLCTEFQVPGSPTFSEAIRYIKEHYPSTTLKFLEWWKPFGLDFQGSCFVAKTATLKPRAGNMPLDEHNQPKELIPKCMVIKPLQGIVLNSVGLSGPGADHLISQWLRKTQAGQWVISFMAVSSSARSRIDETSRFFEKLEPLVNSYGTKRIGIQLNFSCPNVEHITEDLTLEVSAALDMVKRLGILTLIKLNALVPVEVGIDLANHEACDGIVMSNTIPWGKLPEQIDWKRLFGSTRSPLESLGGGGLSGWPLCEIVGDWIHEARIRGFTKYIVAGGGILSKRDVDYMFDQGANGIEIGSVAILRPWRVKGLIRQAINHSPTL